MTWTVSFENAFEQEFAGLDAAVQEALLAHARLIGEFGPQLGRPHVDTLKGSKYANMKELRFEAAAGVWRVAFAFDSRREAILLVAGDKSGRSEKRFYKRLIAVANRRYAAHLATLERPSKGRGG